MRTPTEGRARWPLSLLLLGCLATLPAAGQQNLEELDWDRIMQEHMRLGQPGPEHDRIASLAGTWDMEITMWPEPGAAPVQLPPAVVESEMILGGRFLQQHGRSEVDGMVIETMSLFGFDRRNDLYNLIALDTSGTYWVTASGQAVDESTIVLSGSDWDGIVGGEQIYDFVLRWEGPDTLVTEIIFKDEIHTRGGPPHKMVETRSRRRPSGAAR